MSSQFRDRTQEFFSTVENIQRKQSNNINLSTTTTTSNNSNNKLYNHQSIIKPIKSSESSQFTEAARAINIGITDVANKLIDLVAKNSSLVQDQTNNISNLTAIIKRDMNILNNEVVDLEKWIISDSNLSYGQNKDHNLTVVSQLKSSLANQASSFTTVLMTRTKTLKDQSTRRQQFSSTKTQLPTRKRMPNIGPNSSGLYDSDVNTNPNAGAMVPAGHDNGSNMMKYEMMVEDNTDSYLASRVDAVQDIERTITELSTMYQRLAFMVKAQEEQAVRLDITMEDTLVTTENAHNELNKYLSWVQSNRWLMIKIFAILIFFAMIFVMFIQ